MRAASSHLEFDLNLAKEQSEKNPVYYLQYAHARIASILRYAEGQGTFHASDSFSGIDYSLLKGQAEIMLVKLILDFPETIEACALNFEPHRLTTYLHDVATAFHKFYHEHRVVIPEIELAKTRLALCLAAKTVLANGCKILGISAPEQM
jgi:arginyl-tRNA synthetase